MKKKIGQMGWERGRYRGVGVPGNQKGHEVFQAGEKPRRDPFQPPTPGPAPGGVQAALCPTPRGCQPVPGACAQAPRLGQLLALDVVPPTPAIPGFLTAVPAKEKTFPTFITVGFVTPNPA